MAFDLEQCWDCPTPYQQILVLFLVGFLLFVFSALLTNSAHRIIKRIGKALSLVALFWYFLLVYGVHEHGIVWPGYTGKQYLAATNWRGVSSPVIDTLFYVGFTSMSVASILIIRSMRKARGA